MWTHISIRQPTCIVSSAQGRLHLSIGPLDKCTDHARYISKSFPPRHLDGGVEHDSLVVFVHASENKWSSTWISDILAMLACWKCHFTTAINIVYIIIGHHYSIWNSGYLITFLTWHCFWYPELQKISSPHFWSPGWTLLQAQFFPNLFSLSRYNFHQTHARPEFAPRSEWSKLKRKMWHLLQFPFFLTCT